MKTVVIITTGQPSVNPRVVKEADAMVEAGFKVTVLFCFWIIWAQEADATLLSNVKWNYFLIGGSPSRKHLIYYFTKARFKVNIRLNRIIGNRFWVAERAQARCFDELLLKAKAIKADWYIGHNLGSLAIVVKAASYNGAAAGFDFEDYHREENVQPFEFDKKRILYLEEKYVPKLSYISASSPLIAEKLRSDFSHFFKPLITILNCFPISRLHCLKNNSFKNSNLSLFWFSQTIGKNRGLELVILALVALNNQSIHLTLAGRCDNDLLSFIEDRAFEIKNRIHFAGIIKPDALPAFAAGFDVGLATEITTPLNRNICLTNKIFTYLVAGNCILASDTAAQKSFLEKYTSIGLLYKNGDIKDLSKKIMFLYNNKLFVNRCKDMAIELATTRMNWEVESTKLIKLLNVNESSGPNPGSVL